MQIITKIINSTIYVTITDVESDIKNDFDNFSATWKKFYVEKKYFTFRIDTTSLTRPNILYCYKMAKLIREFKDYSTQYLKYSIMIIPNPYVRYLLNIIMRIQKPVATIYVTKNNIEANSLYNYKLDNSVFLETFILLNNISVIES